MFYIAKQRHSSIIINRDSGYNAFLRKGVQVIAATIENE
jgi:hypothetical protein